MMHGQKNNK